MITITVTIADSDNPSTSMASFASEGSNSYHDVLDASLEVLRAALVAHGWHDDWDTHDWPRPDTVTDDMTDDA